MSLTNSKLLNGQFACLQRIFTEDDLRQYNELAKDFNSIYQHHDIGLENGDLRPIIPALLVEGLISQVITDKLPGMCLCIVTKRNGILSSCVYWR